MNRSTLLAYLRDWLAHYPEDVFGPLPPVTPETTQADRTLRTLAAVSMARHMLGRMIADAEEQHPRLFGEDHDRGTPSLESSARLRLQQIATLEAQELEDTKLLERWQYATGCASPEAYRKSVEDNAPDFTFTPGRRYTIALRSEPSTTARYTGRGDGDLYRFVGEDTTYYQTTADRVSEYNGAGPALRDISLTVDADGPRFTGTVDPPKRSREDAGVSLRLLQGWAVNVAGLERDAVLLMTGEQILGAVADQIPITEATGWPRQVANKQIVQPLEHSSGEQVELMLANDAGAAFVTVGHPSGDEDERVAYVSLAELREAVRALCPDDSASGEDDHAEHEHEHEHAAATAEDDGTPLSKWEALRRFCAHGYTSKHVTCWGSLDTLTRELEASAAEDAAAIAARVSECEALDVRRREAEESAAHWREAYYLEKREDTSAALREAEARGAKLAEAVRGQVVLLLGLARTNTDRSQRSALRNSADSLHEDLLAWMDTSEDDETPCEDAAEPESAGVSPETPTPKTLTLAQVIAGAERARQRVALWPAWKRDFASPAVTDTPDPPSPPSEHVEPSPPDGWKLRNDSCWSSRPYYCEDQHGKRTDSFALWENATAEAHAIVFAQAAERATAEDAATNAALVAEYEALGDHQRVVRSHFNSGYTDALETVIAELDSSGFVESRDIVEQLLNAHAASSSNESKTRTPAPGTDAEMLDILDELDAEEAE